MYEIVLPFFVIISLILVATAVNDNVTFGIEQLATAQILPITQTTPYQDIVNTSSTPLTKEVNTN
jgi:hypothetical protein